MSFTEAKPYKGPGWWDRLMDIPAAASGGTIVGTIGMTGGPMADAIALSLHQELLAGAPVALAPHGARLQSIAEHGDSPYQDLYALLYVLSGYPELVLV